MEAYSDFAYIYDELMDNTPYSEWCRLLDSLIGEYGVSKKIDRNVELEDHEYTHEEILESEKNLVLDLGCGTGTLTEMMYKLGYDMIGVDYSSQMLEIAQNKRAESGSEILYLNQDMRELDMYSTVGTVFSVCDSVNYLLEDKEVVATFSLVNKFLYPCGIFIFDFNTVHKYQDVIGDSTIAESRDDCAFIWDNYYDEESHINEYDLSIFIKNKEPDEFRRVVETHYQRGYSLDEMLELVRKSGLEPVKVFDAESYEEPDEESERIFVVARKGN